ELCVLLLAAHVFGDKLTLLNWSGFGVCICGIALHVALRTTHTTKEHRVALSTDMELLLRGGEDEDDEET
ncbi:hypothetical protein GDO81_021276, partial [Engystomops pustulosus]